MKPAAPRVAWRLALTRDRAAAFAGSPTSNRWNGRATRPVYAAEALSLAALERLIYTGWDVATGADPPQYAFRIEIPADVEAETIEPASLPNDWQRLSAPLDPAAPPTPLQQLGDAWYTAARTALLRVPSAHVPEESNLLLNPTHPAFRHLAIHLAREFRYDPRLATRLRSGRK